ncbi:Replication termination factor 2 [Golovinomyces cichoracearum]|uniref:Replication termination factor 2 n=1 Tax=Golovinomyces cichoracearum TaxID=62708 RepID=A0A420J9M7_9PEZI|nr:Replication termination factor 2 [Golovinomyces cichoracearum]
MGNDGGSIPRRIELVKEAARKPNTSEIKATLLEAQTHAWKICPLSNQPLVAPIVSDSAGVLYNKDAILEKLIPKTDESTEIDALQGRVSCLRDVVEVHFTLVKDGDEEKKVCSVTSKELGPNTKAVYLVPCGHAFWEVAIRELKSNRCVECDEEYMPENIINILPSTSNEVSKLAMRINKLRQAGLTHSLKKAPGCKKRRKAAAITTMSDDTSRKDSIISTSNGIKNLATASLTSRVLEEQEERNKRRKIGMNENLKSLFSSKCHSVETYSSDFMTRGFSLPTKKMK